MFRSHPDRSRICSALSGKYGATQPHLQEGENHAFLVLPRHLGDADLRIMAPLCVVRELLWEEALQVAQRGGNEGRARSTTRYGSFASSSKPVKQARSEAVPHRDLGRTFLANAAPVQIIAADNGSIDSSTLTPFLQQQFAGPPAAPHTLHQIEGRTTSDCRCVM